MHTNSLHLPAELPAETQSVAESHVNIVAKCWQLMMNGPGNSTLLSAHSSGAHPDTGHQLQHQAGARKAIHQAGARKAGHQQLQAGARKAGHQEHQAGVQKVDHQLRGARHLRPKVASLAGTTGLDRQSAQRSKKGIPAAD